MVVNNQERVKQNLSNNENMLDQNGNVPNVVRALQADTFYKNNNLNRNRIHNMIDTHFIPLHPQTEVPFVVHLQE